MNAQYAAQVLAQIRAQAPSVRVYAGVGDAGLVGTVQDNQQNGNRSTANIVSYLKQQGLNGITIDSEQFESMSSVPALVAQLGPGFRAAGLGIAVSVPWPGNGPASLYGANAAAVFNQYVDALELQDYSSDGTPADVPAWISAGVSPGLLMGGVATENGGVQTSLADTAAWTQYAMKKQMRGMFSWRLDNDHGQDGTAEDANPTFTGAQKIFDTVNGYTRVADARR
jgi:hypothetical protein